MWNEASLAAKITNTIEFTRSTHSLESKINASGTAQLTNYIFRKFGFKTAGYKNFIHFNLIKLIKIMNRMNEQGSTLLALNGSTP